MKASHLGLTKLQHAAAANGDGVLYNITGAEHVVVCVSGTFVANVYFEASIDGNVWHEVAARDLTTTNANDKAKTITAPGLYGLEHLGGLLFFRARISGYASGAVDVKANAHG
jgi:hypothetical protein